MANSTKRQLGNSMLQQMTGRLDRDIQAGKLKPTGTAAGTQAKKSTTTALGKTVTDWRQQKTAKRTDSMTEDQLKKPFKADALNLLYHQTVKKAHSFGSKDPLEDAYRLTSEYRDNVKASYAAGAEDPMGAARKLYDKGLKALERNTGVQGKSYEELLDKLHGMGGYLTDKEWAESNLPKTEKNAMALASGDLGDVYQTAREDADKLNFYQRLPQIIAAMDQAEKNGSVAAAAISDADQDQWADLTDSEAGRAWLESIQGKTAQERQQSAKAFAARLLGQEENENTAAVRARAPESEDVQWLKDYIRRNTTQGAQAWLDEATGTADEQAAKDALYFAGYKEKEQALAGQADYAEKSAADAAFASNPKYRFINNLNGEQEKMSSAIGQGVAAGYGLYRFMDADQIANYNYLYATEGKDAADDYLNNYVMYSLNEQAAEYSNTQMEEMGQQGTGGAVLASVLSVPFAQTGGVGVLDNLGQRMRNLVTGKYRPIDYNTGMQQMGALSSSARKGVQEQVDWNANLLGHNLDVFDLLYGGAMSSIDSVVGAQMGSVLNTIRYTSSAAQDAALSAKEAGANDGQILGIMAAAGFAEWLGEAIPFDKFFKMAESTDQQTLGKVIRNALEEGFTNAPGEMVTEAANALAQKLILGEKSDAAQEYQQYLDMGLDEKEAWKRTAVSLGWQIGEAGLGGFLQGAGMGAAAGMQAARGNRLMDRETGKGILAGQTGENLKALALSLGEDTEVGQMGAKYNPETATAKETGKLFRAVMNALPGEQNKGDVQQGVALGLASTLKQLGETGNAFSIAHDVLDVYQGYDLNEQQRLELANSTQGMALLNLLAAPEAASNSAQAAEKTAWSKEKKANLTESEADLQAAQQARELAQRARARRDGVSLPQATEATAAAEAQQGPQQTQQAAEAWLETAPEAPDMEQPDAETQETKTMVQPEQREERQQYSLKKMPDGKKYVEVDTDQHLFDGASEEEYKNIARSYIRENFVGKMLGENADIAVNGRTAKEYVYPANRRMSSEMKNDKYRAATELGNMILASEFVRHEDDKNGKHPEAVNGWDVYNVIYKVGDRYYQGETQVKLTEEEKILYDITKIRDVTRQLRLENQETDSRRGPNDISKISIPASSQKVNEQKAENNENRTGNNLPEGVIRIRESQNGVEAVTESGKAVPVDELDISQSQKTVLENSAGMSSQAAESMAQGYEEGRQDAQDYSMGFQRVYQAAKAGKTLAQIQSLFGEELTQQQRQTAYEQGRAAAAQEKAAAAQEKAAAAQNNARLAQAYDFRTLQEAKGGQGGLYFAAVSQKVKSNAALAQLRLIDAFAKEYGLQVRLFDTLEHGAVNGLLEKGTNIINLALDAQDGALTRTVSHEAYHYIAQQSQEQAQRLEAFVRQRLESAEDYDLKARIREKQAEYRRSGVALTAEEAMEEITADSVLDVIGTEENIQRLVKQDQKLAAKVGQVVKALAEKLRQLMRMFAGHSPEARALNDDLEYTEKIAQMMEEALAAARENYRMAQEGQFTAAKQDAAVQAYISDMQTAATAEDAQAAMNGLVSDLFARSQTAYLAARPDMDLNDAVARFGEALKGFGTGESPTVQGALARAGFNSPQDGDSILAPLAYAGKKLAGMEERGMETETKYQMKANPRVDEITLEENKKTVSAMNPVKELTGDEFTVGGSELRNQVAEYFEQIGATAYNDELGDVTLSKSGVKSSLGHGMGKEKAAAFAAVNDVIEHGKIIDFQKNWKGRNYDTAVVSAPITIGGEDYYMGVVVKRTWNAQSFYLHEVILQKESGTESRSTRGLENQQSPSGVNPTINSILETVRNYKGETEEKVSTDNDNSYDLKEQSLTEQVSQDAALHSQMRSSPSIRAAAELMQKLHRVVRRGDGYLQGGENEPVLKARAWDKRRGAIADKILSETGSTMSRNTLMRRLSTLYRGMDRLDMDTGEMLMYARSVGRQLLENSPGIAQQQDENTRKVVQTVYNNVFYLTNDMKSEIRSVYGTQEDFTRKNFGKMKIRSKEGAKISLAELWAEKLNPLSPEIFAADATEADMPIILDAYLETAGKKRFNGAYGANIDQYATDLGLSMMLEYYDVPGGIGKAEELRQKFIKAREDMRQSYAQHYQERLTSQARRRDEYRQRDALRSQILRDSKYLAVRVNQPSDSRHVPEGLQGVAETLSRALRSGERIDGKALAALAQEYKLLGAEDNEYDAGGAYDADILTTIEELQTSIAGKKIKELTNPELQDLADVAGNLQRMISAANEIFINGRKTTLDAAGEETLAALVGKKDVKREKLKALAYKNTTPVYFFDNIGGHLKQCYDGMLEGQNQYAFHALDAQTEMDRLIEKYHVNDWYFDKEHLRFETAQGRKAELSRGEALSLYALWNRETRNKRQNAKHLQIGGFKYGDVDYEGVKKSRPHRIGEADMNTIKNWLTKEQMDFADAAVHYLSTTMADLGNETSKAIYGYKKFTEEYYFPYKVSRDYVQQDLTRSDDGSVRQPKSMGMSKATTRKANNPILLGDFIQIWSRHVNDMCVYNAFAQPVDTINRLFNYKSATTGDAYGVSVKEELQRVYGKAAVNYLSNMVKDVSGGVVAQERTGIINKWLSKFKKNAVAANASVVIQQPSAIMRAMVMVNPKYFIKPANPFAEAAEMEKYSGVALIKSMGRFDTGTGFTGEEWITHSLKAEKWTERAGAKMDEITGWGAEQADRITWGIMWAAIKRETADINGLQPGTEAFFQEAAKRFNDVMNHTQVYDSILVKSDIMRGKSTMDKMITAFMAEPTVSYNLLQNAIQNLGKKDINGKNIGRAMAMRAVAAFAANTLFNAMRKSLVSMGRRWEDEDRTIIEKYLAELSENFTGDMNPLSMVPVARDIVSIWQGYDVERSDMSVVTDLKDAYDEVMSDEGSFADKTLTVAGALGNLLGIPAKNVIRDIRGMLNIIGSAPIGETSGRDIKYGVLEGLSIFGVDLYDSGASAYYQRAADALQKGKDDKYQELLGYLEETRPKEKDTAQNGVRTRLEEKAKRGQMSWDEYFALWQSKLNGKSSTMRSKIGTMYKDGRLDAKEAEALLGKYGGYEDENDIYYALQKWNWQQENPDAEDDYSRYGKVYEAVKAGKSADAAIREMTQHGYTEGKVKSQIADKIGTWYIAGEMTRAAAEKALRTYTDKTDKDDIWFKLRRWDYQKAHDGSGEGYSAYGDFLSAVRTGTNLRGRIEELTGHGVSESTLAGQITAEYKEEYIRLYKTDKGKAAELKARLLTAYAALGYDRNRKNKDIDKWLTQETKKKK